VFRISRLCISDAEREKKYSHATRKLLVILRMLELYPFRSTESKGVYSRCAC
jgi:hypothetical protein